MLWPPVYREVSLFSQHGPVGILKAQSAHSGYSVVQPLEQLAAFPQVKFELEIN